MYKIFLISCIGYLTGTAGFLPGAIFSISTGKMSKRFHSTLLGFTAGLLISFVCFEMLPVAFESFGLYYSIAGIIIGVFTCFFMENKINNLKRYFNKTEEFKIIKAGLMIGLGVMLHNIPEGMAVGSILNYSYAQGISMSVIIAIHCFPEAMAVFIPLKQGGISNFKILLYSLVFGIPMALGAFAGAVLSGISAVFVSLCLSFAGGVMLYITCGEIMTESKDIWKGRLSTVGAAFGFVVGIIITSRL